MTNAWTTHHVQLAGDELEHLEREWLLTNGSGAYAMGTLPGVNTRRYHGLLIAATHPPVGRIVALNQMLEQLEITSPVGKRVAEFATCQFHDSNDAVVYAPQGLQLLRRFDRGLAVTWVYQHAHIQFVRTLSLPWRQQAAVLEYQVAGLAENETAVLRLSPMLTLRDFHSLLRHSHGPHFETLAEGEACVVRRDGANAVRLAAPGMTFTPNADWWYNLYFEQERRRGLDHIEDNFIPGRFELPCAPGPVTRVRLTVSLGDQPTRPRTGRDARHGHLETIAKRLNPMTADDNEARALALASDDFLVARTIGGKALSTIIAGYPWFSDWGRDTFIALPGLLLTTGRFDEARDTLRTFAAAIRNGLVPNRFDDQDEQAAHYNTVDASLWFIHAGMCYLDATNDYDAWEQWLSPAICSIIDNYIRGTDCDIRVAGDGMVTAGHEHTQLTWMDAKCNDVVFTPRHGKAVEINALWYHALCGMSALLKPTDRQLSNHYHKLSQRIKRAFLKVFWNDQTQCLRDHVWTDGAGVDHPGDAIRPNQIFAAALPYSPIPQTKQRLVLKAVKQHLLTPYGLRTLAPEDGQYHAHYRGGPFDRDGAYHQGTVWPWLIGPYCEAVLRVGRFSASAKDEVRKTLAPLRQFLREPGLGQLYEIHEAAPPHQPAGCVAQAWSIASLLRTLELLQQAH